jgi:hypothetical protein
MEIERWDFNGWMFELFHCVIQVIDRVRVGGDKQMRMSEHGNRSVHHGLVRLMS